MASAYFLSMGIKRYLSRGLRHLSRRLIFLGNGDAATDAESLARDFQSRGGLAAFVFVEVDEADDAFDGRFFETGGDYFAGGFALHDICVKDGVQNIVGREAVLVRLVGAQLGG